MKSEFSSHNQMWAALLVEELIRGGVALFAISPGSRSTPLALAVAENERADSIVHFDERGASFCALGHVRATGKPAAVICTSGTAVGNLYPAVLEAAYDYVPLILLTADRPPELQDCGANQTIDQGGLFGKHVRWHQSIDCPDASRDPVELLQTVDHALNHASGTNSGPVHLNLMFREPLAPEESSPVVNLPASLTDWASRNRTFSEPEQSHTPSDMISIEKMVSQLSGEQNVIVVAGRMQIIEDQKAVRKLSDHFGWLLLPDIASGLRLGSQSKTAIANYDLLLAAGVNPVGPDISILHLGRTPLSKRLSAYLVQLHPKKYIKVQEFVQRDDPFGLVTDYLYSEVGRFCEEMMRSPIDRPSLPDDHSELMNQNRIVSSTLNKSIQTGELTEPAVARLISSYIPGDACLFVASSRPIRDMDSYASSDGPEVPVGCNRGVSGIDGTIASAVGFARGYGRRLLLLIGDLAFLHDLNSLPLLRQLSLPATILLVNNDGGGIFSFLPVVSQANHFEKFFGTPHGYEFENCARLFGLEHYRPKSVPEVRQLLESTTSATQHRLIEVKTDRNRNYQTHQQLIDTIRSRIQQA
ncbi:MAG: 2-succinyl-5-enolpyruvyl-6-hydroxy-3-cyclohexene-1-carboxylic-acid synthase [bacterium]|nr:2-succinyl-5-enolpyruvyl-6-hydroxy-3-cyclohexene-1-carboxylic-acid synthase [bacterium]